METPQTHTLTDKPANFDRFIAILFWWMPLFALAPFLFKGASSYLRLHARAVWTTFVILVAVSFLIAAGEGFRLFAQNGDAIVSFAQAIPSFEETFSAFSFDVTPARSATSALNLLWGLAVIANTILVLMGHGPYSLKRPLNPSLEKSVGVFALLVGGLALSIGFAVAGEVGASIDRVDLSTTATGVFCMMGGFVLLGNKRVAPTFAQMALIMGISMMLGDLLIRLMNIDLETGFLASLGIVVCIVSALVLLLSSWYGRVKRNKELNST